MNLRTPSQRTLMINIHKLIRPLTPAEVSLSMTFPIILLDNTSVPGLDTDIVYMDARVTNGVRKNLTSDIAKALLEKINLCISV